MLAMVGLLVSLLGLNQSVPSAHATAGVPPGASLFVPAATPTRLADTRESEGAFGFTRLEPTRIRVQVAGRGGVPSDASAAVLTVTSVGSTAGGFVTVYPSGTAMPLASNLNVDYPGRVIANLVTARLGGDGAVEIYSNMPTDLVVDVAGAYVPTAVAQRQGRLVTISGGARRVLDTRELGVPVGAGGTQRISLLSADVPSDASAVVVTITAVDAQPGYWTAFAAGAASPWASNLNIDLPFQTRSGQAIVPVGTIDGVAAIDVFSQSGGHLVIDVAGWFTGASAPLSTDGLFVPSAPIRLIDTRDHWNIAPWGGTTVEVSSATPWPDNTAAVALNVTATDPWNVGYVTAFPAGSARPFSSNLNVTALDQTIANHAIVRLGERGVSLFTQSGTNLVADAAGWYLGAPDPSTLPPPVNPSTSLTLIGGVSAADVGVGTYVGYNGNLDSVIDRGLAALWVGSGTLGTQENNVLFAHRTSAGGPFRNLDRLKVGSTFTLVGVDGRSFQFLVTRTAVMSPSTERLLQLADSGGPITATLVACQPPGSTAYRIVVVGRLIGLA
jgi:LPXTG-site transpeptidase (sortase) family protein